jgi:hypothetical protein
MEDKDLENILKLRKIEDHSESLAERIIEHSFKISRKKEQANISTIFNSYLNIELDLESLFLELFSFKNLIMTSLLLFIGFGGGYLSIKEAEYKHPPEIQFTNYLYGEGNIL